MLKRLVEAPEPTMSSKLCGPVGRQLIDDPGRASDGARSRATRYAGSDSTAAVAVSSTMRDGRMLDCSAAPPLLAASTVNA